MASSTNLALAKTAETHFLWMQLADSPSCIDLTKVTDRVQGMMQCPAFTQNRKGLRKLKANIHAIIALRKLSPAEDLSLEHLGLKTRVYHEFHAEIPLPFAWTQELLLEVLAPVKTLEFPKFKSMLIQHSVNLNVLLKDNEWRETLFSKIIDIISDFENWSDCETVLKICITAGALLNNAALEGKTIFTPLHKLFANPINKHKNDILKFLLTHGADPHIILPKPLALYQPLMFFIVNQPPESFGIKSFHTLIKMGKIDVNMILCKEDTTEYSLLDIAVTARQPNRKAIALLIFYGAKLKQIKPQLSHLETAAKAQNQHSLPYALNDYALSAFALRARLIVALPLSQTIITLPFYSKLPSDFWCLILNYLINQEDIGDLCITNNYLDLNVP